MIQQKLFKPRPPITTANLVQKDQLKVWKSSPIHICYSVQNKQPIALQNVHYYLKVQTGIMVVEIIQEYSTQGWETVIELEYLFVINKNATVTKMIVEIGNEIKYGIVKEKVEAQNQYDEGVKQGKTMAYSDQDIQIPEIKKVKIGSMAPNQNLKITFEYIQPLEVYLNKFWKVEISPLIDPSYFNENNHSKHTLINQEFNEIVKKYVLIQKYEFNYKQGISMEIDTGSIITAFKSPTHDIISTGAKDIAKNNEIRKLALMLQDTPENHQPNKKFVLLFSTDDINLPRAILTHTNNDALMTQKYCATLTMIPKFNEVTLDDAYQQYLDGMNIAIDQKVIKGEYLFFLDRSGSMQGTRIRKAKEALILFLKSLPENCFFNIISFGTNCKSLWESTKIYSQQTLDEAIKHVSQISADMGGTEIYHPLQRFVYKLLMNKNIKCKKLFLIQNVFLLTDGIVDAKPIIELITQYKRPEIRIYSLGIGQDCSQYLIRRVAEVGYGKYHIMNDDEDINAKVIDLLEDSLTSYLKGFTLETNAVNIQQIIPAPDSIICLKKNKELMIQVLFSNEQLSNNIEFTLSCYDPQDSKHLKYTISLDLEKSQQNDYFHKIAAHKFINFVEESIKEKEKLINQIDFKGTEIKECDLLNVSLQYQILSSQTAFICEVRDLEDQFKQQAREEVIINRCIQNECRKIQIQQGVPPPPPVPPPSNYTQVVQPPGLTYPPPPPPTGSAYLPPPPPYYTKVIQPPGLTYNGLPPLPGSAYLPPPSQPNYPSTKGIQPPNKLAIPPPPSLTFEQAGKKKSGLPPPQRPKSSNVISYKKESVNIEKKQILSREQPQQKLEQFSEEEECDEWEFQGESIKKQEIVEQNKNPFTTQKIQKISYKQLVLCAQADGSFILTSDLQNEMMAKEFQNICNVKFLTLCTMLSLFYLELFCKDNQQSWQIIFSKGIQFLQRNGINYREERNSLIEKYKQLVSN